MKKHILIATALLILTASVSHAALTVGKIPVTKTGGTTPTLEDSIVTQSDGAIVVGGNLTASNISGTNTGDQTGTDTYVCFFDGTAVSCADAGFAYSKSTDELTAKGGVIVGDGTDKDVTVFTVNIAGTDVTGKWNQTTGQLEFSVPIKGGGTSNTIRFDDGASPDTDETVIGTVMPFTANENQGFGDVVYINGDGEMQLADADAIASSYVLAMATEDITADSSGFYLMPGGIARDDTWNWTVGEPIYLSTTGTTGNTLTQTAPSGEDDAIVIIGVATHSDRMYFFPQLTIIEYTEGS